MSNLPLTMRFDDSRATLYAAGGKGANLSKLARAALPVPPGFLVTTQAYQRFVNENGLATRIAGILKALGSATDANIDALEVASQTIRTAFAQGRMPAEVEDAILADYDAIGAPPVAVRSSATAEDLPDLSFAGQQDTYLNQTRETLLQAVIDCWSSLWTARAIGYRARNAIENELVSLAVVVQTMVQSEVSGVLFTANPLTGSRLESVIDATLGLGEALVSGQVEPDHYVVTTATGEIHERIVGAKALVIRGLAQGGTETVANLSSAPALTDAQVQKVIDLGVRVQALYDGFPQDIEWALAEGALYLLQSRPITSLFPLPANAQSDPPSILFSFAAVQGVFDPLTPLGMSTFQIVGARVAHEIGYQFAPGDVPALKVAAERLWIDVTPLPTNRLGKRIMSFVLPKIVPAAAQALDEMGYFSSTAETRPLPTPQSLAHLRKLFEPIVRSAPRGLRHPNAARERFLAAMEEKLAELKQRAQQPQTLIERILFIDAMFAETVPLLLHNGVPLLLPALACQFGFLKLAQDAGMETATALNVTRGMPHNVTTEMDLALWDVAKSVRADDQSFATFLDSSASELAQRYLAGTLPKVAQQTLAAFLARYGMRGVAEIDMGRKRWREDPTQIMQTLQNYLRIDDQAHAPDAVFARGQQEAQATIDTVVDVLRAQGKQRTARAAAFVASRARALAGLREYPKFTIIRLMGIARDMLDPVFADLAQQGVLDEAGDGVWLTMDELCALDAGYQIDWKALVCERKALYAREKQRTRLPIMLLGDGRVFYGDESVEEDETGETLRGQPVSAGVVEGVCHVVLEPHNAMLAHGEILVCPATDPAWTPLFLSAGGLVMEVGGMMTHGSVVAREYGIPAVIGVRNATTRLATGMRVRVNGSTGVITILDEEMGS